MTFPSLSPTFLLLPDGKGCSRETRVCPIQDQGMVIELNGMGEHRLLSFTKGPLREVVMMLLCSLLGEKTDHLMKTKSVSSFNSANYCDME